MDGAPINAANLGGPSAASVLMPFVQLFLSEV